MAHSRCVARYGSSGLPWLATVCAFREVLVAPDADEAGDRGAAALVRELRALW